MSETGCDMKLLSTYFPESFQEGGVEGTLGELCNDIKAKSYPNPNVLPKNCPEIERTIKFAVLLVFRYTLK